MHDYSPTFPVPVNSYHLGQLCKRYALETAFCNHIMMWFGPANWFKRKASQNDTRILAPPHISQAGLTSEWREKAPILFGRSKPRKCTKKASIILWRPELQRTLGENTLSMGSGGSRGGVHGFHGTPLLKGCLRKYYAPTY